MKVKIYILMAVCSLIMVASSTFGYQVTISPRIRVAEQYTDNLFLTYPDKEHDYITLISPGITAEIEGKGIGAGISYDPTYTAYANFNEKDTWRHTLNFSGWTELTKTTRLDLSDTFLLTDDPDPYDDVAVTRTDDPAARIDSTVRKSRQNYYSNTASANLMYNFGEFDTLRLGYNHYILKNDDPTLEDSESHNPTIGLTYRFLPKWGLAANATYTRGEFEISDDRDLWFANVSLMKWFTKNFQGYLRYSYTGVNYIGETEDDQTYNPSIGIVYAIANDISLTLDIGYYNNNYEFRDDQSGLTLDGRLKKTFKRGSINLSTLGGYDYSLFGAENLGFTQFYEVAASGTYSFTKRLSGDVFGSYRDNNYKDTFPDRDDLVTSAGLGLAIQPLNWMSIQLRYTYRSVDSTVDTNDYEENRGLIGITLFFPTPFRFTN
jgi:hypothetical protein